jgi:hypothetical protein
MRLHNSDRPLISVHFPKAGGVSFLSALNEAFGADKVLKTYDCDPVDPSNPWWIHPTWFRHNRPSTVKPYMAVHGHFPIQKYDLVSPAVRVVMLREPVENLISIYYYWKSLFDSPAEGHGIYAFVKKQRLSLLEMAQIPVLRRLMSVTFFGDFDMRRFDVIGAHERRSEFIDEVSKVVGIPLSTAHRENVTPPSEERGNVLSDTIMITKLRYLLQDDIRFYETYTGAGSRKVRSFFLASSDLLRLSRRVPFPGKR